MSRYRIEATWDPEATVWVATSEGVPGLATESATLEALATKLRTLVPELLEANRQAGSLGASDLVAARRRRIACDRRNSGTIAGIERRLPLFRRDRRNSEPIAAIRDRSPRLGTDCRDPGPIAMIAA